MVDVTFFFFFYQKKNPCQCLKVNNADRTEIRNQAPPQPSCCTITMLLVRDKATAWQAQCAPKRVCYDGGKRRV
jgi:hypothetical protein